MISGSTDSRGIAMIMLCLSAVLTLQPSHIQEVVSLQSFEKRLGTKRGKISILLVYSPFCPVCKRFDKIYTQAAKFHMKNEDQVSFFKINSIEHPSVLPKYRVTFLPAVFAFKGKDLFERMRSDYASQEYLALNWVKQVSGDPEFNPFFSQKPKTERIKKADQEFITEFEGKIDDSKEMKHESRLARALFSEVYGTDQIGLSPDDNLNILDLKV